VSEEIGSNRGLVRRQERAAITPLILLGPGLVTNSLCRGQEKRTMQKLGV
jgi:hypothetical protein